MVSVDINIKFETHAQVMAHTSNSNVGRIGRSPCDTCGHRMTDIEKQSERRPQITWNSTRHFSNKTFCVSFEWELQSHIIAH
jgi:hypothetical protein